MTAHRFRRRSPARDAGSHAVDLLAHIGAAPVVGVRARADETGRVVHIDAKLGNGVRAECTIGHSARYEEHLSVLVVMPRSNDAPRRDRVTAFATRFGNLRLAWCKLTGRSTPAGASFRSQLSAFAAACRGEPDAAGADAADGLRSVAVVEACLRSIDRAGDWCDVSPTC